MRLDRRQVLKASFFGGLAGMFGGLGPSPRADVARAAGLDSYEMLRSAIRFGKRLQLGSTALADGPDDTALVTIKVMNHIHTPLCFRLGGNDAEGNPLSYTGGTPMVPWETKFRDPVVLGMLRARGLDRISGNPRFARLRMNGWWSSILATGAIETGRPPDVLDAADVGPFPSESEVAIQAALGVNQTDLSLNHSFKNCVLPASTDPNRGGDIGFHCARQGIIESPLGLVCLNMGGVVETTDSIGNVPNRVVGSDQVTVAALGRSVGAYVRVVSQAIGLGLVDEALVAKFDAFVRSDSTLAGELSQRRGVLRASLASLGQAAAIETAPQAMDEVSGAANFQLIDGVSDQVAQAEFLSQCKFVQRALDIPGKPFRNFNLFLNIVDLDGAALDTSAASPGSIAQGANPYSYVEGMRQLAVGLNMLAQVIKKHRNVYVVVVSEGGRGALRTDDKVSHAILMGPGGAGNLKDHLYANQAAIDSTTDPFVTDPNQGNDKLGGAGQRKPTGQVVASEGGTTLDEHITTAGLLVGLVRHLEGKRGVSTTTTGGLGKFVRIQKA